MKCKTIKNISATVGFFFVLAACFSEQLTFSLSVGGVGCAFLALALVLTRFRIRRAAKKRYAACRTLSARVEKIPELC